MHSALCSDNHVHVYSAHQLYLRAVQLGAALSPALPKGMWYRDCVNAVQAYRDKLQAEEAKKWANRRIPILEKLSKEMNGAKEMNNLKFAEVWLFLSS
jgi:hypothetical protein